jgi:hypothetical protein
VVNLHDFLDVIVDVLIMKYADMVATGSLIFFGKFQKLA